VTLGNSRITFATRT